MTFAANAPCRRNRPRGFTLLEMTIALAMVAILGASLYASMSVAFRARDTARRQTEAARDATIALDVIAAELANVLPPNGNGRLAGPFYGTSAGSPEWPTDTMDFHALGRDPPAVHAAAPGPFARAGGLDEPDPLADGARWVQIAVRADTDPPALVRSVNRNLLATVQETPVEEVLLTGVRSLGLRYFDGYAWEEEWDSTARGDSLPLAVEVTLELTAPHPTSADRPYRVVQVSPRACARPDQIAAAAEGGAGG